MLPVVALVLLSACSGEYVDYQDTEDGSTDEADFDDHYDSEEIMISTNLTPLKHAGNTRSRIKRFGERNSVARTLSLDEIQDVKLAIKDLLAGRQLDHLTTGATETGTNYVTFLNDQVTKDIFTGLTKNIDSDERTKFYEDIIEEIMDSAKKQGRIATTNVRTTERNTKFDIVYDRSQTDAINSNDTEITLPLESVIERTERRYVWKSFTPERNRVIPERTKESTKLTPQRTKKRTMVTPERTNNRTKVPPERTKKHTLGTLARTKVTDSNKELTKMNYDYSVNSLMTTTTQDFIGEILTTEQSPPVPDSTTQVSKERKFPQALSDIAAAHNWVKDFPHFNPETPLRTPDPIGPIATRGTYEEEDIRIPTRHFNEKFFKSGNKSEGARKDADNKDSLADFDISKSKYENFKTELSVFTVTEGDNDTVLNNITYIIDNYDTVEGRNGLREGLLMRQGNNESNITLPSTTPTSPPTTTTTTTVTTTVTTTLPPPDPHHFPYPYSASQFPDTTTTKTTTYWRTWRRKTTTEYQTTTEGPQFDIPALVDIVANLTSDFESNITQMFNKTLQKYDIPTCPSLETTTEPIYYELSNATVVSKCFVCGMHVEQIPGETYCADAFATEFFPLVPIDPQARGHLVNFRKYCRYLDVNNFYENETEPRSIYGRFTGGCSVRWIDLSGVYTQRACRNRRRAMTGKHFASKRMAKLEMALNDVDNGCVISPMASLVPLSRGISLYARFHACVCTGNWCNITSANQPWIVYIVMLVCWTLTTFVGGRVGQWFWFYTV